MFNLVTANVSDFIVTINGVLHTCAVYPITSEPTATGAVEAPESISADTIDSITIVTPILTLISICERERKALHCSSPEPLCTLYFPYGTNIQLTFD